MRNNKYEKILSVSGRLISQKGFREASLKAIASEVGLDKSSLFHYFKNKEELLLRVLEQSVGEVNKNLENIIANHELEPEEKLRRAIDNHLTLLSDYFDNVTVYLNELRSLSRRNQTIYLRKRKKYGKDFEDIIKEMKTKGFFKGLDTKIVTFGVLGMLNWATKWYKNDGPLTIKEVSNIFYRMITQKQSIQKD
jgi:AcrR family transcriptional regulator